MEQVSDKIYVSAHNYAWDVMGLDPIGASDMLSDWAAFVKNLVLQNKYAQPSVAWENFNEEVIKPIYKLDLPALPEYTVQELEKDIL